MHHEAFFRGALDGLRREGRYRVFADLERQAGALSARHLHTASGATPRSRSGARTTISAWASTRSCSHAMHEALDRCGAGAGGTRNISGTNHYHVLLERELADLHGKEAALLFTSGYVSNWAALGTLASQMPGCVVLSDAGNHASMIEGIRHSRAEKMLFAHNDPSRPRPQARGARSRRAEARRLRVRLFDGRRHRSDRRALRRRRGARRHDLSRRGPCGRPVRPARRRHCRARRPEPSPHRDRGHARQGLRRHGRLHRGLGRAVRFRAQLRLGLHLHDRAAAGARRRRARQHPSPQGEPRRARAPAGPRRRACAAGSTQRRHPASRQPEPHRAGDGRRRRCAASGSATSCSTITASTCSRSTTRRSRAAPSACASRRRRCTATPTSTTSSPPSPRSGANSG